MAAGAGLSKRTPPNSSSDHEPNHQARVVPTTALSLLSLQTPVASGRLPRRLLDAAGVVSDPWRPLRSKSRDELAKIAEKMLGKGAHIEFTDGTDEVRVTKLFCQIETPTMR